MKISVSSSGSFAKTETFLKRMQTGEFYQALERYAIQGRNALVAATPRDSGISAESWTYEIVRRGRYSGINWSNTHRVNGFPVAIMLQYGHGTGTGGYVQGQDYINPAIKPIFDQIANAVWKEVTRP